MNDFIIPGKVNIICDGQFGSTGKGLIASYISEHEHIDVSVGSLSPNAGHTFYINDKKYISHLIPVSAVWNKHSTIFLSSDCVINTDLLFNEIKEFEIDTDRIVIHPRAAVVTETEDYIPNLVQIGSTKAGTGPARASKILRQNCLAQNHPLLKPFVKDFDIKYYLIQGCNVLVETGQGLDLGLNHGFDYPHCTSRDILPSNILGELGVSPRYLGNVCMTLRTFPIRVGHPKDKDGNIIGNSGPFYPDSKEISFEELGVKSELTTVTKRIRRIATWSEKQFYNSLYKIEPTHIFLNFCNYLREEDLHHFSWCDKISQQLWCGYGPYNNDVIEYYPKMLHSLLNIRN